MKKALFVLCLLIASLWILFNTAPKTQETKQANPGSHAIRLDDAALLVCKQCTPASEQTRQCINCRLERNIVLKSGEVIRGTITAIESDRIEVQVDYGKIFFKHSELKNPVPETEVQGPNSPSLAGEVVLFKGKNLSEPKFREKRIEKPDKPGQATETLSAKRAARIIKTLFKKHEWIAYSPSQYFPGIEQTLEEENIRKDLNLLASAGFDALVTYSAAGRLSSIPRIARETGFQAVMMGIWDPTNRSEFDNAVSQKEHVDAYCVGNEGLHFERYTMEQLLPCLIELRKITQKPVSSSEPLDIVLNPKYRKIWQISDWVFVIAHYVFDRELSTKDPVEGVKWMVSLEQRLNSSIRSGKPLVFKEVGFPTQGDSWASMETQESFLRKISRKLDLFVYFEAFDQPWKTDPPIEAYWGLFKFDRTPKPYAAKRMKQNRS